MVSEINYLLKSRGNMPDDRREGGKKGEEKGEQREKRKERKRKHDHRVCREDMGKKKGCLDFKHWSVM